MKVLRVALVVPNWKKKTASSQYRKELLKEMCHADQIDLVVHDECFLDGRLEAAESTITEYAEGLRTPVLSGYYTSTEKQDSYITAAYANPNPQADDTRYHLYFKHSSACELPYSIKGYQGRVDPMFDPIQLSGHKFGVTICHDMFFGLISARHLKKGATSLFNLTGGNVQLKKWRMICQARSIELGGPFMCTMALTDQESNGRSAAIAYQDGAELKPISNHLDQNGTGGFAIYELVPGYLPNTFTRIVQNFSSKQYSDIRLSLNGIGSADIKVIIKESGVEINGEHAAGKNGKWFSFELPAGKVGVLPVPLAQINDPRTLYQLQPKQNAFDHHIVIYYSPNTPDDKDRVMALLKLRTIEHRIAACILAGDFKEVLKTNNYKNIQRMRPKADVFGLNRFNLWGTHGTYRNAIPQEIFGKYLDLL